MFCNEYSQVCQQSLASQIDQHFLVVLSDQSGLVDHLDQADHPVLDLQVNQIVLEITRNFDDNNITIVHVCIFVIILPGRPIIPG